jgi:protease II
LPRRSKAPRVRVVSCAIGNYSLTQTTNSPTQTQTKLAGDFLWAADSATLFYVTKDALDRPHKVWRHAVGGSQADDALVYHEEDEAFYVGLSKTASRRTLLISAGSAVTSDVRALAADNPAGEWTLVLPRVQGVEYDVEDRGEGAGRHLFITLRDAARPNSELLVAPAADPAAARPLLPHRADVKLEHVAVSRDFLVAFERREGLQAAVVYALPPGEAAPGPGALVGGAAIAFDLPAYEMGPGGGGDWASPLLRFHMSSLAAPDTAVDHHMGTGERATKKVAPVKGGFDPSKYVTERLWAPAPDGVQVPISLVYRRELFAADGSAPLLLDAYGSYGEGCCSKIALGRTNLPQLQICHKFKQPTARRSPCTLILSPLPNQRSATTPTSAPTASRSSTAALSSRSRTCAAAARWAAPGARGEKRGGNTIDQPTDQPTNQPASQPTNQPTNRPLAPRTDRSRLAPTNRPLTPRRYEDGKFLKKRNTFTDFVACAEMLIQKKYTSPARLGVEGRSAGGLTIGAALNLRPDLFAAAVLGVPFVDALTTMLDETIPLTVIEREEWGDPREAEFYNYMKSYSPVDNIREGAAYPAVLVTAGLHDPRVGYWEPAKYVAKLRRAAGGPGRPLALLKCELGAGHFSQSGRFDRLKETAVEHAFLLKALGMLGAPLAAP